MAYFCFDCWNETHKTKIKPEECVFSKELLLCEGCEEHKIVILGLKEPLIERIFCFLIPSWRLRRILVIIGRVMILPYYIIKYYQRKKKKQNKEEKHR